MKYLVLIPLILFLFYSNLDAQQKHHRRGKTSSTCIAKDTTKKNTAGKCFVQSSDSCKMIKSKCRMKDSFIDKDGDGINDNRCNGMGLGCPKRNRKCGGGK